LPRRYEATEANFTIAAGMDLLQVKNGASSGKMCKVIRWYWKPTDNTLMTAQIFMTRCRVLPATVTDGTGGTTATPRPLDPGDSASTVTVLTRNTTPATTSGTARTYDEGGSHGYNGYEQSPDEPVIVPPGSSFTFELTSSTVQGTVKMSVGVEFEELG
jgi:hypothetical protein